MNGQIKKYIYIIATIIIVFIVLRIFIRILPWLILAGAVTYGVIKIKGAIKGIKEKDTSNNSEFKSEQNNENSFENGNDSYTNGEIIDVDYEEIDKDKK